MLLLHREEMLLSHQLKEMLAKQREEIFGLFDHIIHKYETQKLKKQKATYKHQNKAIKAFQLYRNNKQKYKYHRW